MEEVNNIYRVRAIVINQKTQEILLGLDLKDLKWGTPGGNINKNETQEDAILRELKEEINLEKSDISNYYLLMIDEKRKESVYVVYIKPEFLNKCSNNYDPDIEFSDLKWFSTNNIPKNTWDDVFVRVNKI